MDATADTLPEKPVIAERGTIFYSLTIDPLSGEIYVGDAIDYTQSGVVLRYSPDGQLLDSFDVGVNPGNFCWRAAQ